MTTINPEPVALFLDLVVLGDGEDVLASLLDMYQKVRETGPKHEILKQLAQGTWSVCSIAL